MLHPSGVSCRLLSIKSTIRQRVDDPQSFKLFATGCHAVIPSRAPLVVAAPERLTSTPHSPDSAVMSGGMPPIQVYLSVV
jgi:hypothetical protein